MAKEAPVLREVEVEHETTASPYQSSTIWITNPHGDYFYGIILYYRKTPRGQSDSILNFRTHTLIGESIEDVQKDSIAWIATNLGKVLSVQMIEE